MYPKINKVRIGNVAIFTCYDEGTVKWTFKGYSVPAKALSAEGHIVMITNVQLHNAGKYICHAYEGRKETSTVHGELKVIGEVSM